MFYHTLIDHAHGFSLELFYGLIVSNTLSHLFNRFVGINIRCQNRKRRAIGNAYHSRRYFLSIIRSDVVKLFLVHCYYEFCLSVYLPASKGLESHFFQFFAHPRGWKAIFSSFRLIQGVGKPISSVLGSSKGLESQFLQFSARPRGWKACLRRFFSFGRGRNAVFAVFRFSAVAETLFSLFFTLRPWPKRIFFHF